MSGENTRCYSSIEPLDKLPQLIKWAKCKNRDENTFWKWVIDFLKDIFGHTLYEEVQKKLLTQTRNDFFLFFFENFLIDFLSFIF